MSSELRREEVMGADRAELAFDPALAAHYGAFIAAAYETHGAAPDNPTPPPSAAPSGFTFIAWVQMKDFVLSSGAWAFYGLVAQSTEDPDQFVLALRGTSNPEEWWDDLTSMVPAPWAGPGRVGFGFNRIYQTLRIVEFSRPASLEATALGPPAAAGSFAEQVAGTVHRHAAAARPELGASAQAAPSVKTIAVTGHSLGASLATLYVAENAEKASHAEATPIAGVRTSVLCTFASPRTGDPTFAAAFDALPITSWRIVNELDVVPKLPAIGFTHVNRLQEYNSGTMVRWSPSCWHALETYLHLLDPKLPLDPGCSWSKPMAASALAMAAPPQTPMPAAKDIPIFVPNETGATINITIKIG